MEVYTKKKNIGIIGGGCAGTILAWQLKKYHDIKLFESSDKLGGHIYTHTLDVDGEKVSIDMGVDHINEKLCPNIYAILRYFGIRTFKAPLTMNVTFCENDGELRKWSNASLKGDLFKDFKAEFVNFFEDMKIVAQAGPKFMNIAIIDFLKEKKYSEKFAKKALMPLLTSYYGPRAPSLEFSVFYVAYSFNMKLLSFLSPGEWEKIEGGTIAYIENIYKEIKENTYLNSSVTKVRKNANGNVEVFLANKKYYEFDEIVFATHADSALKCIENPSSTYSDILGNFGYVPISATGHFDNHVDQNAKDNEYFSFYHDESHDHGCLTRINNNLNPYRHIKKPLMVSFDLTKKINSEKIFQQKNWKLQMLRPIDGMYRSRISKLQGIDNMWFCGTDTSITGHEGAVVSSFVLAGKLGVPYLYQDNPEALQQYNIVKYVMGV